MKSVVITGSTRGIGRGLAENFLARGCSVVVSGRSQESVDRTREALAEQADSDWIAGRACEVTDSAQLEGLWDEAVARFGQVDIWINNAGVGLRTPVVDAEPEQIEHLIKVNLTGLLLASRVASRGMREQGHGQIWNMEGYGSRGEMAPGMSIYGASKRAVGYLNKALNKELADSPVQVCALSPGIVVTDLLIGDCDTDSEQWEKSKKIFNILGDRVETVAPFLVERILRTRKRGTRVAWLTRRKAFLRFLTAAFNKRDLFEDLHVLE